MKANTFWFLCLTCLMACAHKSNTESSDSTPNTLPSISGKPEYLGSPFVTAGDRVYMVGHQDGSFPDLGWHITGEMGGIWDHPIKLMDGFSASIIRKNGGQSFCLDKAEKFVNFPMANLHQFSWQEEEIAIERSQFVPDGIEGIVIEFKIMNQSGEKKELIFSFTGHTDLQPTWLGERTNMINGEDEISYDKKLSAFIAKDINNPWYTAFGSPLFAESSSGQPVCVEPERKSSGKSGTLNYDFEISAGAEIIIPVFIAGASDSESSLRATFDLLRSSAKEKLQQKTQRYQAIADASKITIPDKEIAQMYEWLKYNTDWLVRTVPGEGTGLSAGLPDYPWWFGCDNTYALQGVLATGDHELTKKTIELIYNISRRTNNNGRIIHEVSTNGAVFNPGNVNETAQFTSLLLYYYSWTGDKETIMNFFPDVKKGIQWLMDQDPDHNGYPNGNGLMEIHGLDKEMIDVAVYTQQALSSASVLAKAVGETALANAYQKSAEELKVKINQDWWQEDFKSYGDFIGTPREANQVIDAAIIRADTLQKPWAVAELKNTKDQLRKYGANSTQAHVVYHNWVVNTPMETGIADPQKAKAALEASKKYENPFGVFVTGIDRTEEEDSLVLKSRKKIFSYVGAVMTIPTGVQAVASARYGDPDNALNYIKKLQRSFSYALPGSMYEVSPDFGMITQAWNIYGVAVPVIQYFFGIQPRAYEHSIYLSPNPPTEWDNLSIENVKVGNNSIDVSIQKSKEFTEYKITQTQPGWTIFFNSDNAKRIRVNGKETTLAKNTIEVTGRDISIQVYK